MEVYYFKCKLSDGSKKRTAWIPEHLALEGKRLTLNNDARWEVIETSDHYIISYEQEKLNVEAI